MKTRTMTISALLLCLIAAQLAAVPAGEFATDDHKKTIGSFHFDMDSRNWHEEMTGIDILTCLGMGFGLQRQLTIPGRFSQHKLFYLSFDNTLSLNNLAPINLLYSFNLGFTVRTFIPFLKLSYGTGLNFKVGYSGGYPPWGVYGMVGIDFHTIMINSKVIFHPGTDIIENELQVGFVFLGRKYR